MRRHRVFCIFACAAIMCALEPEGGTAQTTVNFASTSPVDLGTNLSKLADLDPWSYTLGTDWDERFRIGGIIGAPNTTVIPEVTAFGATIIPEVKADTRTGAQMQGRVWGDVGLEFSADFLASGLEPGIGFQFAPTLSYDPPEAGSFFQLATTTGVQENPAFTEEALELPAVDAQVDFFFNLDLTSSIDYGLFPFVPYNSVPFSPGGIHLDQRNDPDKSLVRFQASLDPDDNNGSPLPPTLTFLDGVQVLGVPLETQVGLLDDGQFLANKQISFEIKDKKNLALMRRIDVGEVQVLNPFGTGGDLLGGSNDRNLQVQTSMENGQIGYSFQTPLFRLGLDLDGIAAGLATGQSFTRLEEDIKIGDTKVADIAADFIDLKYGPELGFRESVEINPDFEVTLNFQDPNDGTPVAVAINDNGSVSLMSSFAGRWGELPQIALLTPDAVEVSVSFDALTGEQSKRGAFYLSDYLEFTLLELESLNILDVAELSLPPVFRTRTSLLGDLLGELELEAYTDSAAITPFALGGALPTTSFTITPAPSVLAYLTSGGTFDPERPGGKLRMLADHSVANDPAAVTMAIGLGDMSSQMVADLSPTMVTDNGAYTDAQELVDRAGIDADALDSTHYDDPTRVAEAWGLSIPAGSTYEQFGARVWELPTVANDGYYHGVGQMTTFQNPGGTLLISGSGEIEFEQHARIAADVVIHGNGHTLRFDTTTGYGLVQGPLEAIRLIYDASPDEAQTEFLRLPDQVVEAPRFIDAESVFVNAGILDLFGAAGEIYAGMSFDNNASGRIDVVGDGGAAAVEGITITTPDFTNNGTITVGPGSQIDFRHPDSNLAQQFRGDGVLRVDGGSARFITNVSAYAPDGAEAPNAASQTFEVTGGGSLEFQGNTVFYAKPTFTVGSGSELTFNGLGLDGADPLLSKFGEGPPIDVVNEGRIVFNSGSNDFKLAVLQFFPNDEPTVIPIGLDNRGTVTIQNTARLTLDAEIRDYAEGGATFDAGTWEIIGPTPTELYNNLTSNDSNVARLNLNVSQVEVGDNFLTVIDPGRPDGDIGGFGEAYDATDYDTFLSVNKSHITLSGRAKFAYLNALQTNAGRLALDNRNHFTTAGDLTNTGTIDVTRGSRLEVSGDLLVDGGAVNIDETSTFSAGNHTIEVVGGSFVVEDDDNVFLPTLGTKWIVRERVLFDEDGNVTGVAPGLVDLGGMALRNISANGAITLAGEMAEFRPLEGLVSIDGSLTLESGNSLTLVGDPANPDFSLLASELAEVNVLSGANLIIDSGFVQMGRLMIGEQSFLEVAGPLMTSGNAVTQIDGVLQAEQIDVLENSTLTGSGRISGDVFVEGTLDPGHTIGALQTFGSLTQAPSANLVVDLDGPEPGAQHDQVLAESAALAGTLTIQATPDGVRRVLFGAYGERLDIVVADGGTTGKFDVVMGGDISADYRWILFNEPDRVSLAAAMIGDANFNGTIEQADLDAVLLNWGATSATFTTGDYDDNGSVDQADLDRVLLGWGKTVDLLGTAAVPEPSTAVNGALLGIVLLFFRCCKSLQNVS